MNKIVNHKTYYQPLLRSPVFRAMLELDQPAEISVEDTEPVIIKQLLKYLYIGKLDQDFTDYKKMIILANKYGLRELVDFSSLKLLESLENLSQDNVVELGIFGEVHNSEVLLNGSANFFLKTKLIPDILKQEMTKYPKLKLAIIRSARQKGGQEVRNVSEFTWFKSGAPSEWTPDDGETFRFKVSQRSILVGIGLYGSKGRNKVSLRLGDTGTWFDKHDQDKSYLSEGGEAITKIQLSQELELVPDKTYEIHVERLGLNEKEVWKGETVREESKVNGKMLTLIDSDYKGHLAAIYLASV